MMGRRYASRSTDFDYTKEDKSHTEVFAVETGIIANLLFGKNSINPFNILILPGHIFIIIISLKDYDHQTN